MPGDKPSSENTGSDDDNDSSSGSTSGSSGSETNATSVPGKSSKSSGGASSLSASSDASASSSASDSSSDDSSSADSSSSGSSSSNSSTDDSDEGSELEGVFDVDDLLAIRQTWKKKGKRIVKRKTFGMKMLEKSMNGARIDMGWVHGQHRASVKAGEWKWHHAGASARAKSGSALVSVSLRKSKPINEYILDVNDFLPSQIDVHSKERKNLGVAVMRELRSGASTCDWKKYNTSGSYACTNGKLHKGAKFCAFHHVFCVNKDAHEKKEKIRHPNADALCADCYLDRYHKVPPKLKLGIPGVQKENMERTGKIGVITSSLGINEPRKKAKLIKTKDLKAMEDHTPKVKGQSFRSSRKAKFEEKQLKRNLKEQKRLEKALSGTGQCNWHGTDENGWRYKCLNPCAKQKQTGAVLKKCKFHVQRCILDNPWQPICAPITVPNPLGVCRNHYLSFKNGKEPPPVATHSVPGTKCLHEFDPPPDLPAPHILAPREEVPLLTKERREILQHIYAKPPPTPYHCCYRFFCVKLNFYGRITRSMWYKRKYKQEHSATQINKIVRGYLARTRTRRMYLILAENQRDRAVVVLQRNLRGHNARAFTREHRRYFEWAHPTINRVLRGALERMRYKRMRSANRIQRWWRFVMARDQMEAIKLKSRFMNHIEEEIRKEYERKVTKLGKIWRAICANRIMRWWRKWWSYQNVTRRNINAITIQRVWRGKVGRDFYWNLFHLSWKSALDIQRVWRGYCARVYAKWYISTMMKLVPAMQRLVRGHLARKKAHKEREALEENWTWLNPSMPRAAFAKQLARNNPYKRNIYLKNPDPFRYPRKAVRDKMISDEFKSNLSSVGNIGTISFKSEEIMSDMLTMQELARQEEALAEVPVPCVSGLEKTLAGNDEDEEAKSALSGDEDREPALEKLAHGSSKDNAVMARPRQYFFLFQSHLFHGREGRMLEKDELKATLKSVFAYPAMSKNQIPLNKLSNLQIGKGFLNIPEERLHSNLRNRVHRLNGTIERERERKSVEAQDVSNIMDIQEELSELTMASRYSLQTPPPRAVTPDIALTPSQGMVYLDMLLALSNEDLQLIENRSAFVGYVFSSWIWMDTMWQSICSDIRKGKISGKVPKSVLSRKAWRYIKSTLKPNPERAEVLESALKTMCFHTRAGKMVEVLERLGMNGKNNASTMANDTYIIHPVLDANEEQVQNISVSSEMSAKSAPKYLRSRDLEPKLSARTDIEEDFDTSYEEELLSAQYDFVTTGYDNSYTRFDDPRWPKAFSVEKEDSNSGIGGFRFVCSLPGCGKCSSTKQGGHDHYIRAHGRSLVDSRAKLKSISPIEHMLSPLWPSQTPWQEKLLEDDSGDIIGLSSVWSLDSTFSHDLGKKQHWDVKSSLGSESNKIRHRPSGGNFFCKRVGCNKRFISINELINHQSEHRAEEIRKISTEENCSLSLEWRGTVTQVPKAVRDGLVQCEQHRFAIPGDCLSCRLVLEKFQPKAPIQWYRKLKMQIKGTDQVIKLSTDFLDDLAVSPMIDPQWIARAGGEFQNSKATTTPLLMHVLGLCIDDYNQATIAGRYYYTSENAIQLGKLFHEDIPSNYVEKEEVFEDEVVNFVPVSAVIGYGIVVRCSRLRWSSYQRNPIVMNAPVSYFSRIVLAPSGAVFPGQNKKNSLVVVK
jgi:hypothetical protein